MELYKGTIGLWTMSITKKEVKIISDNENKLAIIEQRYAHICAHLGDIKNDVKEIKSESKQKFIDIKREIQDEHIKIWKKLEFLDQRINDNFKWLTGIMVTLFSGLYATALGGMLLRLCHWI